MADADVRYDDLRIIMDLQRFGELVAHVAAKFAQLREIEQPDFDGQEMRDLAISSWRHLVFMADREQFKQSVVQDLEQLTAERPAPEHRPEFGFFEPPL